MRAMTPAERFFWKHGGYSWKPGNETRAQGRRRCAVQAAEAEAWAVDQLKFEWVWDETGGRDHEEWCGADCGREHEILGAVARWNDGSIAASLWGIIDPDTNYRRVVEAELASEARHEAMTALLGAI